MSQSRTAVLWPFVAVSAFAVVGLALLSNDGARLQWQHAARWTADLSAVLFLSVFVPQASRLFPGVARRDRVLGFLVAHLIHAAAFVVFHALAVAPEPFAMVLGGLGYLTMGVMVSVPPASAPRLHQSGIWYLWLVFVGTFAIGFSDESRQVTSALGVTVFLCAALARLLPHRKLRAAWSIPDRRED